MSTVKSKKLQVGTDASASNNFTIYQPATPDGTLRIGVGNADSPTEVGQFNANGYKPATAPAFRVNLSANQSISTSTATKLQLDTEQFDTTGDYDSTTNYRFTPSVAGYYQVNLQSYSSAINNGTNWTVFIYKNGSVDIRGSRVPQGALGAVQSVASGLVYMNGTTDYIEFYVLHTHGGSREANAASPDLTQASGILIQQA